MNEQNLKPFTSNQNREEAVKNGRKGGIASGKKRREQKTFSELCKQFGEMAITNDQFKQQMLDLGIAPEECTNKMAMIISLWRASLKGNVNAITQYAQFVGEKPADKIEETINTPVIIRGDDNIAD